MLLMAVLLMAVTLTMLLMAVLLMTVLLTIVSVAVSITMVIATLVVIMAVAMTMLEDVIPVCIVRMSMTCPLLLDGLRRKSFDHVLLRNLCKLLGDPVFAKPRLQKRLIA